jgi:hypothetical protein
VFRVLLVKRTFGALLTMVVKRYNQPDAEMTGMSYSVTGGRSIRGSVHGAYAPPRARRPKYVH